MFRRETLARARFALIACGLLFCPALVHADAGVKVTNAWARSTVPGQNVAAAYFDIVSDGAAALVKAESPAAKLVELHEMQMDGEVMRMRPVARIDLPAGKEVRLEPGGLHVMLVDIKQPLKVGDKVPLTLVVESGGKTEKLDLTAEVKDAKGHGHHH
jgi:copper(I)-binding protein